ncbi:hypothetical protein Hypma_001149, partial [Hypsizygus marmoreus]
KEKLKTAKSSLAETQGDIRTLAPLVERANHRCASRAHLRVEHAEVEKAAKQSQVDEDDVQLVSQYTASMTLHRSFQDLHDSYSAPENELRLTHNVEVSRGRCHRITIALIFAPDTRNLGTVQMAGLDELGVDVGDLIHVHVQVNDVHGIAAATLARVRTQTVS